MLLLCPGVVRYNRDLSSIILEVVAAWTQKPWKNHGGMTLDLQKMDSPLQRSETLINLNFEGLD